MVKVITTEKRPIKMWLDDLEDNALDQAKHLANLPFIFKHVAMMADGHLGYGMPIGGVIATIGVVIPYAVGSDKGCGVCSCKTSLTELSTETLKQVMDAIRKVVPIGVKRHDKLQPIELMPPLDDCYDSHGKIVSKEWDNAVMSLGTLGSGNHFIEIQKGSDGHIWITLHSGSRHLGKKACDYYHDIASKLNEKWYSKIPKEWNLAFLPINSDEGRSYLQEMRYCVDYAFANRKLMMNRIKQCFSSIFKVEFEPMINIAHNYASMESHFGQNVMVHRKGATLARKDTVGIIPGSQGTATYIVQGKGNPDSFQSCSHGAGRKMGRNDAKRSLDFDAEVKKLEDQGIVHTLRTKDDLDEADGAYKSIDTVMKNQEDLVDVLVKLKPLGTIKGKNKRRKK